VKYGGYDLRNGESPTGGHYIATTVRQDGLKKGRYQGERRHLTTTFRFFLEGSRKGECSVDLRIGTRDNNLMHCEEG